MADFEKYWDEIVVFTLEVEKYDVKSTWCGETHVRGEVHDVWNDKIVGWNYILRKIVVPHEVLSAEAVSAEIEPAYRAKMFRKTNERFYNHWLFGATEKEWDWMHLDYEDTDLRKSYDEDYNPIVGCGVVVGKSDKGYYVIGTHEGGVWKTNRLCGELADAKMDDRRYNTCWLVEDILDSAGLLDRDRYIQG